MKGSSIVGRTQSPPLDMYCTPTWAASVMYKAMLRDGVLNTDLRILEPCSGTGNLVTTGRALGLKIKASDIQTRQEILGRKGVSLWDYSDNYCDCVVTNPPYKGLYESGMLKKLLDISKQKTILLLNLNFLESLKRKPLFDSGILEFVYVYRSRVTMYPYGTPEPTNGGTKAYAWFVFNKSYTGEPHIRWLDKED